MNDVRDRTEKTIKRSLLVVASDVLSLFKSDERDSLTMGEMREQALNLISKDDLLKVIDYTQSPADYIIIEDVKSNY